MSLPEIWEPIDSTKTASYGQGELVVGAGLGPTVGWGVGPVVGAKVGEDVGPSVGS